MKIPFVNYPKLYLEARDTYLNLIDSIFSNGGFIMQSELDNFEKELSTFINSNFSIGVGNATDGLEIALMSLNLKPGDEVICSAHTMVATASSIKMAGATPKIVDIGADNLIDPDAISEAINSRTVGIMPTQLNGRTCNMDKIMNIAEKNKLFVVEDAAQALGSKFKEKNAGTFGIASAISFYPAKVLGCFGDGGAFVTNNKEIFHKAYQLHDHGRDVDGEIKSWGRNSRLDNFQAAILSYNLKNYQDIINKRRNIAEIYNSELKEIEELKLPTPPSEGGCHFDVFQNYEFEAKDRDNLQKHLKERGISTLVQWSGKAVHQWESLGFDIVLPKVEEFFKNCLMIPNGPYLSNEEIYFIINSIKSFYKAI